MCFIECGPQMFLVAVIVGTEPKALRSKMRRALVTVWDVYKVYLKKWNGSVAGMDGLKDILVNGVLR